MRTELDRLMKASAIAGAARRAKRVRERLGALSVSLEYNYASRNGEIVRLYPQEAEFVFILLREYPEPASKEKILIGLYGRIGLDREYDMPTTCVYRAKYKLRNLNADIKPVRGGGYRLVLH